MINDDNINDRNGNGLFARILNNIKNIIHIDMYGNKSNKFNKFELFINVCTSKLKYSEAPIPSGNNVINDQYTVIASKKVLFFDSNNFDDIFSKFLKNNIDAPNTYINALIPSVFEFSINWSKYEEITLVFVGDIFERIVFFRYSTSFWKFGTERSIDKIIIIKGTMADNEYNDSEAA